jgi:hypothetical protein
MIRWICFGFLLSTIFSSVSVGQQSWEGFVFDDDAENEAIQNSLTERLGDIEFGLQDFFCKWQFYVESSPDSDLLFRSRATLEYLRFDDDVIFSSADWLYDEVQDLRNAGESAKKPFRACGVRLLTVAGKAYRPHKDQLFVDNAMVGYRHVDNCVVLNPLEVPFLFDTCFDPGFMCGGAPAFLGGRSRCIGYRRQRTSIQSVWLSLHLDGTSQALALVTSADGLPTRFELLVHEKDFKYKQGVPSRNEFLAFSVVHTEWGKFEGISVPIFSKGVIKPQDMAGVELLQFEAKMSYSDKDSQEFIKHREEIKPLVEKIKN